MWWKFQLYQLLHCSCLSKCRSQGCVILRPGCLLPQGRFHATHSRTYLYDHDPVDADLIRTNPLSLVRSLYCRPIKPRGGVGCQNNRILPPVSQVSSATMTKNESLLRKHAWAAGKNNKDTRQKVAARLCGFPSWFLAEGGQVHATYYISFSASKVRVGPKITRPATCDKHNLFLVLTSGIASAPVY